MQDRQTPQPRIRMGQVRWLAVDAAGEPALSDMLADPITQLLMRRDGVQEGEIRRLAARLQQRRGPAAANDTAAELPR
ncbi:hypothetical protein [Ferrovibrio sp.]|uniref:hypothetical protein n=1 Tax=Ferrovibrio sp. TaxID=1917215 RepID=UPI00311FAB8A